MADAVVFPGNGHTVTTGMLLYIGRVVEAVDEFLDTISWPDS